MNQQIKTSLGVIIIIIIIVTVWMFIAIYEKGQLGGESQISQNFQTNRKNNQKACTMEAILCPDGSSVSRTGPKCEFAPCPELQTGLIYKNDSFGFQLTLPKEWQNYKTKIEGNSIYFELPTTDATWKKDPRAMVFVIEATPLVEVEKLRSTKCSQKCIDQLDNAKVGETIKIEGYCTDYYAPACLPVTNPIGKNSKYAFSYITANNITDYPKDFTAELFAKADEAIKSFIAN